MKKIISCFLILIMLMHTSAYAGEISSWAEAEYTSASGYGLISYNVVIRNMKENITREEFCDMVMNLYASLSDRPMPTPDILPFEDSISYAVAQAYELGIVSGMSETEFAPDNLITREQLAKMLVSVLVKCDAEITLNSKDKELLDGFADGNTVHDWAENSVITLLKLGILNGIDDKTLAPLGNATREQAIALVNRTYEKFEKNPKSEKIPAISSPKDGGVAKKDIVFKWGAVKGAEKYRLIIKDSFSQAKIVYTTKKTTATIPFSKLEQNESYSAVLQADCGEKKHFSLPISFKTESVWQTQTTPKPTVSIAPSASAKAATTEKELRVFESGFYFSSKEEAQAYMEDITVDVWKINSNGEKYASTIKLTVNRNLAEDVKSIFKEIFEDEGKFPIKSAGGFQWRNTAGGRLSQHSYGTCIDINPNENYYVTPSGKALSGSYWKPGEDPYSITEDGIVVKTFAKYGFLWGGNAWGEKSNKDYMHFTYLGN